MSDMHDSLTPGEQTVVYVSKFCPEIDDSEHELQLCDSHSQSYHCVWRVHFIAAGTGLSVICCVTHMKQSLI